MRGPAPPGETQAWGGHSGGRGRGSPWGGGGVWIRRGAPPAPPLVGGEGAEARRGLCLKIPSSPLMPTTRLAWGSSSNNISLKKKKILIWSSSASSQARGKAKRDRGRVPRSQQGVQGQEPAPTCPDKRGATDRPGAGAWLLGAGVGGGSGGTGDSSYAPRHSGGGGGGSGRPPSSPTPPRPLWGK